MIRLIRIDGIEILLNVNMIRSIEGGTETVVNLHNGERLVVKNHPKDITEKIKAYHLGIMQAEAENKTPQKETDSNSSS